MELVQASIEQLSIIKNITIETIKDIYPHYYPKGAVDFFVSHHNDENISHDIIDKNVYLLYVNKIAIGTITIKDNEICRLFVLPQYQRKGYGSILLDFAENKILQDYEVCLLDASLPAKSMYLKKGYKEIENHIIETKLGDYLCYDVMSKNRKKENL
ncbi:MAG: GNAT family N-acetyltransferase [Coprobacillus sp.]